MTCRPLALTWPLSTISGYGVHGIYLALQFLRRGGERFIATHAPAQITLPALMELKLAPTLDLAKKLGTFMAQNQQETLAFDHAVLYAVGNECAGFAGQDRVVGKVNVGCAAIEHLHFGDDARAYAKNYDFFITFSRWNGAFLNSLGGAPAHICHQGMDTALFHPAPKAGLWPNRFLVFSGGKFEFRKGQDIVVAAFKRFHARHPDAMLVTCWQNLLPIDPRPFEQAGHCTHVPAVDPHKGLHVAPWLLSQGLPQESFIDLPYTPNMLMPPILRECDVALFPNRCEGGTNMVAMETLACGVPSFVANNTGQKDLVDLLGVNAFTHQKSVNPTYIAQTTQDWGETDPDEIVEVLEATYTRKKEAEKQALEIAHKIEAWDWSNQNEKMLKLVCD